MIRAYTRFDTVAYTNVTDRQTDGQTARDGIGHVCSLAAVAC